MLGRPLSGRRPLSGGFDDVAEVGVVSAPSRLSTVQHKTPHEKSFFDHT